MNYLLEFITYLHIIGVAIGFGGAIMSDAIFFATIRDFLISKTEYRFMQLGSRMVWLGVAILLLSGIGLVFLKPELLVSPKFQLKMILVLVIIANGIVFHHLHMPRLRFAINSNLHTNKLMHIQSLPLLLSGVTSVVSWFGAALLGSLSGIPVSFLVGLFAYFLLLVCGYGIAWLLRIVVLRKY